VVHLSTKLNQGHVHGRGGQTLIAPVLARDEETQPTTQESMFNYVRLSDGGQRPPAVDDVSPKSEVEILATLAEAILPPGRFDWASLRSHAALRARMAEIVPGLGALAEKAEFTIPGRVLHTPRFSTPTGRAAFHVTRDPDRSLAPDELMLMTLRSEGQFNTVVYEEEDLYRGNTRRDVVMMAEADAKRLGVGEGDPVWVTTSAGRLKVTATLAPIRAGNLAMYYPEANVLVPRRLDPQSKTPAFKSVPARITLAGRGLEARALTESTHG
jgi:anaerobic selenocysteine-containing dehydrogenase